MRNWLPVLLACAALHAATVRGNVVEHQTGKPLSRVTIRLQPLPGFPVKAVTAKTNTFGVFEIADVQAGAYLLTASRANFVTVQYGQKQWQSAGEPLLLADGSGTFLNIRMPHFAAISGRVVDENEVGVPHQKVLAYRNTRPVELAAQGQADERGDFRIFGLKPGQYLIRTAPLQNAEVSYVPTFAKDADRAENGRVVEVNYDQDATGIEIKPAQGKLIPIHGTLSVSLPKAVNLTFATDMGRETIQTAGPFSFSPVPPGTYELYSEGTGDNSFRCMVLGGWQDVAVREEHDLNADAVCTSYVTVGISGVNGQRVDRSQFTVLARRIDLAGPGPIQQLAIDGSRAALVPGKWELQLKTPPNYYVAGFSGPGVGLQRKHADGWNAVTITRSGYVGFTVGNSPGGIHGTVTGTSHEPVGGAPVYLEIVDRASNTRVGELRMVLADTRGQYKFQGLAPGDYNILATFEYQSPDFETMSMARPQSVYVREASDAQLDLDLFVLR